MRFPLVAVLVGCAVACLAGSPVSRAQESATVITGEITDGPVIGRQVASMTVMNSSCFYGTHFHYELTAEGELRVHAPLICGKVNAGGGELVCVLGPELNCQSRKEYGPDPNSAYAVDANGVTAGGKLYAWANPQQAAALFPTIRARATNKCEHILFGQAVDAKRATPSTPTPEIAAERAACKPVLQQVCSAAHGGAAKLSTGKDVSILCPR